MEKKLTEFDHQRLYDREAAILAFTERIVELMAANGLKRSDLAKKLGRSKPYVTQLLRGANFTFDTAAALALAVGGHFIPDVKREATYFVVSSPDEIRTADVAQTAECSAVSLGACVYAFDSARGPQKTAELRESSPELLLSS